MIAALWLVWGAINAIVFALFGIDKHSARRNAWRIPEKTLLAGTWLFGGVGAALGMRLFHHKTTKRAFQVSAPIAAALSLLVMGATSAYLMGLL